jgi:hypothetical protein
MMPISNWTRSIGHHKTAGILTIAILSILCGCPASGIYYRVLDADFKTSGNRPWYPFEASRSGTSIEIRAGQDYSDGEVRIDLSLSTSCDSASYYPSAASLRSTKGCVFRLLAMRVSTSGGKELELTDSNAMCGLARGVSRKISSRWRCDTRLPSAQPGPIVLFDSLLFSIGHVHCVGSDHAIDLGQVMLGDSTKQGFR